MTLTSLTENKEKILGRGFDYLLYLAAFTLPLVRAHWNAKVIIALAVFWILRTKASAFRKAVSNKLFWVLVLPFFLDMVGMLHTSNVKYGLQLLETKFTLLAFPLILFTSPVSDPTIVNSIRAFCLGVLAVITEYLFLIVTTTIEKGLSMSFWVSDRLSNILINIDENWIDIHPSYLSLYISFATFFIIDRLLSKSPAGTSRRLEIILLSVFGIFQVWLNSRAGLAAFVFACVVFIILKLSTRQRVVALLAIVVFSIALFSLPFTRERFILAPVRAIENAGVVDKDDQATWPISFRIQITQCSVELLRDNRWVYGYGTGDYRDELLACYDRNELLWLSTRELDAHCEYFAQVHRHGLPGLAILLVSLLSPLVLAWRARDGLYIAFLTLIMVALLPENVFSTQKGVVFYALFNALLCLKLLNNTAKSPGAPTQSK